MSSVITLICTKFIFLGIEEWDYINYLYFQSAFLHESSALNSVKEDGYRVCSVLTRKVVQLLAKCSLRVQWSGSVGNYILERQEQEDWVQGQLGVVVNDFNPSTQKEQAYLWVQGQPGLQRDFQVIQSYIASPISKSQESESSQRLSWLHSEF